MKDIKFFLGIDPGNDGGVVLLDTDSQILSMARFDKDNPCRVITQMIRDNNLSTVNTSIALEKVHAFPSQGISSAFNFGAGWGAIRGLIFTLGWDEILYSPQEWQKYLPWSDTGKGRILEFVSGRGLRDAFVFPGCRTMHSGCVDAFGIAEFHRRVTVGMIEGKKQGEVKKKKRRRAIKF